MGTWIRHLPDDYRRKESSMYNLNFLYKKGNIYVMDNHLAAGWAWLQELDVNEAYNFFHIDQHEDLQNNAPIDSYDFLRDFPNICIDDYCNLMIPQSSEIALPQHPVFTWANYIKQVQWLFPHWFKYCIFATHKMFPTDEMNGNGGLVLNISKLQYSPFDLCCNIDYWIKEKEEKWIVNLDLDYFFKDGFRIFSDDYIRQCIENIKSVLDKIAVFTIALSPECCGGWDYAIEVMDIVSEILELDIKFD